MFTRLFKNIVMVGSILGVSVTNAYAQDLPSVKVGRGALVVPATTYYGAATLHTNVMPDVRAPEIKALAAALNNDADLIFSYVKNKIEITPMFGMQKGALGALIDGHGTAFDQAQLMVELLREAGYANVQYQYGDLTLTGVEFKDYFGTDNVTLATNILAYGGIPATVTGSSTVTSVTMKHVWVSVNVDTVETFFDPAYKKHTNFSGIDLASGMSYALPSFKASAGGTTASVSGVSYIENVSPSGIDSNLDTYSTNLLNTIKTSYETKPLYEIIGGQKIIDEDAVGTPWRYTSSASMPDGTHGTAVAWAEVPNQYRTTFQVYAKGYYADFIDATFYVDEIYGRKLELVPTLTKTVMRNYDTNNFYINLKVDGQAISGTGIDANYTEFAGYADLTGRMSWDVELTVNHPYASDSGGYMDRSIITKADVLTTVNIVHGWGQVSGGLMSKWAKEYGNDYSVGAHTAVSCQTECEPFTISQQDNTKAKLGAAWLAQFSRMIDMAGNITGGKVLQHHTVGIVYAEVQIGNNCETTGNPQKCHFSPADQMLRLDLSSGISTPHTADNKSNALVHTVAAAANTLEGSLFEQQMDSVDVASTAERFAWAEDNLASPKYLLFEAGDSNATVENMVLKEDYDPLMCDDVYLPAGNYGSQMINSYLGQQYDEVLAVNDEFLGPGYECGPKFKFWWDLGSGSFALATEASLQRGAAFVAIKKDLNGNIEEIAHVVTSREGSYKGGAGAVENDNAEKFDPAKAADILKDEFKDKSVMHGVDLASGGAAWSSGTVLSTGSGGFPYSLSVELKTQNGINPAFSISSTTKHWTYGSYNSQALAGNMKSEATNSGSGMEAMGASHPWNAVGTIAALYTAYEVALDNTTASNLVLLPFINEWWSDQISNNVVSVSSPAGGYQFVKLPDGTWNPPIGSSATLAVTGSRVAVRDPIGQMLSQTRRWDYGAVDYTVATANKDILVFDAVQYHTTEKLTIQGHKHPLKSMHTANGFGVDFFYTSGDINHGVLLNYVVNDFGRRLNWVYSSAEQYQVASVNDNNGHSVTFNGTNFTVADGGVYSFVSAATPTGARPYNGFQLGKVYLPDDATTPALEYTYNESWQVATVKDKEAVLGTRSSYTFQVAEGFRGSRVDPLGNSYSAWYGLWDGTTNYGKFINEIGNQVRTEFDSWGRTAARIYPEGNKQRFIYDEWSNVIQVDKINKTATETLTATAGYSTIFKNKPLWVKDFNGYQIDLVYNSTTGNLTQATRPADIDGIRPVYKYDYNADGQLRRTIDSMGLVTVSDFDVSGNVTRSVVDCGTLTATVTASCARQTIDTNFTYDAIGNQLTAQDPNGNTTSTAYDVMRRAWKVTDALGNYRKTTFDILGRETKVEAFNSAAVLQAILMEKTYTATGKVATTISPDNAVTINTYDDLDRLLQVSDPVGRITRSVYDDAGQILREIRAYGTALQQDYATYTYSANGQATSVKDANGNLTAYEFDGFDRLAQTTFPSSTTAGQVNPADYESFTYDANGNVLSKRTRAGDVLSSTYDALNRITLKTPATETATVYEYDLVGRPTEASFVDGSHDILYGYDTAGRVTSVTDDGRLLGYQYDAASNRTQLTYPDGFYVDYDYDALNRMTNIWENGLSTIATYSYNALSQRTGLTYGNGRSVAYAFEVDGALDVLDQRDSLNASTVSYAFNYNMANQVTSKSISNLAFAYTPPANDNEIYVPNGLNQYDTVTKNSTVFTLGYDGNGSLTSDGGSWAYGYNVENQLISASKTGVNALFEYDPNGRRSRKSGTGVTDTRFVTDGNEMLAEYDSAGNILRRYVYGANIDERLLMYTGSTTANKSYVHANYQSSTIATSDSFGAVVDMFAYDSYGKTSDGTGIPFKYTGRYYDDETGLYYYRARYYSDELGRFLQTDPIGYVDGLNWYAYVGNDPVNATDPSGKAADCNDGAMCNSGTESLKESLQDTRENLSNQREQSSTVSTTRTSKVIDTITSVVSNSGEASGSKVVSAIGDGIGLANAVASGNGDPSTTAGNVAGELVGGAAGSVVTLGLSRVGVPRVAAVTVGTGVDIGTAAIVGDVVDSGVGVLENFSNSIVESFVGLVEALTPDDLRK